jgi:hypothetical protein
MTSTNPYGTACSSLLSEIHTSLCFGMHSLLQQMLSLFSARPLSCSLLFSQQECFSSSLVLSTRLLQLLSCSLNKTIAASTSFLFLASHQKSLGLSPRFLQLLSCSWHLTKNLLASHQDFFKFFPVLGISPKISWPLTKISSTPKNGCAHLP